VKAAEAVDDPGLDREVLKGDFLSHLVNLGGAYIGVLQGGPVAGYSVAATPYSPLFQGKNFFLDVARSHIDPKSTAVEIVDYYRLFDTGQNTHNNRISTLKLQTDILRRVDQTPYLWDNLAEVLLLAPLFTRSGVELAVGWPDTTLAVVAESNEAVYTGQPPWIAKATKGDFEYVYGKSLTLEGTLARATSPLRQKVYNEEQRLWAWKMVKDYAEDIKNIALEFMVSPDAIVGAILWEAIENPYPLYRSILPQGVPGSIPIVNRMGIPGKIHVTQSNPLNSEKTVAEKLEDEGRVAALSKPGDWKERAKRLSDPKWAIRYIGAILDRAADIYEKAADEGKKYDLENKQSVRDYFNIRDQAGILGALFQGGREEERAAGFENRRNGNDLLKFLPQNTEAYSDLRNPVLTEFRSDIKPELPKKETMGPWISQYRWLIRDRLEIHGIKPFGINIDEGFIVSSTSVEITPFPLPYITNQPVRIQLSEGLLKRFNVSNLEELIQLSRQGTYE
jgi:hypothetical protein